ncbi:MAG: GDSL-type esterase/lipase family protein [Cocleimonas sp.]
MRQHFKTVLYNLLTVTVLTLSGCGGDNNNTDSNNSNSHPTFKWKEVEQSSAYSPSGDIKTTTPSFSWPITPQATDYIFGHENTHDESQWTQYNISADDANCSSTNKTCSYSPTDFTFSMGDQKAWWVRAKVSGQWKSWSAPHVFTLINNGQSGRAVAISPLGEIKTINPVFTWEPRPNATKYRLGNQSVSKWSAFTIPAEEACQTAGQDCSFKPSNLKLVLGEENKWWVQAFVTGAWENWSEGLSFTPIEDDDNNPEPLKAIAPSGEIETTKPVFIWSKLTQASNYQIGYEFKNNKDWHEFTVNGKSAFTCNTSTCSYDLNDSSENIKKFKEADEVFWWVRAEENGSWSNWSNKLTFSIASKGSVKTPQTITFNPLTDVAIKPQPAIIHTLQAIASSGLAVSYTVNSVNICGLSGNSVFAKTIGTCSITATQAGNNNFDGASPVTQSFAISAITKDAQTISFNALADAIIKPNQETLHTLQATASSGLAIDYTINTVNICGLSGNNVFSKIVGICSITAAQAGNNDFHAATPVTQSFSITNAKIIVPEIVSINVIGISQNSATIQWVLNKPTTGQVEYGETAAYGSLSNKNSNLSTAQSQSLIGLKTDTTYHYRVISEDSNGTVVMSTDSTFKTAQTPPNNTLLRILPLGDSITHGAGYNFANPDHSSYRDELYELLNGAQFNFEFVGTDASTYTQANGTSIELKHEGHPSWRADEIDNNLTSWLTSYGVPVDIALVHAGTNDILQTQGTNAETVTDIENIIAKLQASNANITLLIAKIIPIQNPDTTVALNALLTDAWAAAQSTATSSVKVVDHHSGFTASDLSADLIHPNVAGEAKMAQTWFEAITNTTPTNPNNPSLPIQDTSLTLWLDASDADADGTIDTTMANTSSPTWSWKDKSGKSNDVKTIVNSLAPVQLAGALKGKPVFEFETTGLVTSDADQITPNTSYTKFVVFKFDDLTTANNLVSSNTTALWGSHSNSMHAWHSFNDYINPKTPAEGLSLANSTVTLDKFYIASTRYGQPDNLSNVLNLNSILQNSNQLVEPFASSVTYIGSIGNDYYLDGKIAEAIIYDRALTDAEITQVENYLREKWF